VNRIHPEDRELTKAELNKALERTDSTWEAQYRLLRRDGSFAWVLDRAHLIRNGEGRAIRMIGGMSDITERKEQEARITEQATLLDIAHEAIVVKDLSHKVLYWNKGAARIFGWTTEEAIGGQTSNLFHSDATQLERATKTVLDAGEWHGDLSAKRKDGTAITISARWTLVRTNNGEPKSIFSIMSDVTESRKMEKQLLRAQRMESIGTLAGGIAHDLNNVLAPIMMSIEMLKDEVKDAAGRSMLDAIESSARHGAELVKQVLGFARGMDGDRVLINPAHVARDIQRIIRDTFPKNIVLSLSVPKGIWCMKGDATQLHQVLMNLCVNARDAMPNGGRLDISLKNVVLDDVFASQHPHAQKGPHIQITVTDTGLGINKEDLERIFEPFFTTKPTGQGTGLGLSTTLAIVKSHGGFVDVLTELGRGSSFNIYLPAVSGNSADDKAERVTKLPKGNGESILVVDDERSLREIAKATLERNGYRVVLAANGAEAVATYARDPRISLALVDMNMPVMDGAATIAALRQLNPDLGIIASSGVSSSNGCAIPLSAAANRFIAKPYTAEALLISIGETVAGACQQN
jgi:PAS domain S-box-containing protein